MPAAYNDPDLSPALVEYWTAGLPRQGFQVDAREDPHNRYLVAPNDWFLRKLANYTCTLASGVVCPPAHVLGAGGTTCLPASSCAPPGAWPVGCICQAGCAPGHQCVYNMEVACPIPDRCLVNNTCWGGFSGPFCLTCGEGRYYDDISCTPCPPVQHQFIATVLFGSVAAILMLISARMFNTQKVIRIITARARLLLAISHLRPGRWPVTFTWVLGITCMIFFKLTTGDAACLPPDVLNNATFASDFLPCAAWLLCCYTVLISHWLYGLPVEYLSGPPAAPFHRHTGKEEQDFPVHGGEEVSSVVSNPMKVVDVEAESGPVARSAPSPSLSTTATPTPALGATALQQLNVHAEAACRRAVPWASYIYSAFAAGLLAKVADSFSGSWTGTLRVSLLYVNATGQAFRSSSTDNSFYHAFVPGTLPDAPSVNLLQPRAVVERLSLGNSSFLLMPNGIESKELKLDGLLDRTYLRYVQVLLFVVAGSFALVEILPCFFYPHCRSKRCSATCSTRCPVRLPVVRESPRARWARCQRVCEAGLGAIVIVGTAAATRLVDTVGLTRSDQHWATGLYFTALVALLSYHAAMQAAVLYPYMACLRWKGCRRLCGHPQDDREEEEEDRGEPGEEDVQVKAAVAEDAGTGLQALEAQHVDLCEGTEVALLGACTDIALYILAGVYASLTYEAGDISQAKRLSFGLLLTSVTLAPWLLIAHVVLLGKKGMERRLFKRLLGVVALLCTISSVATAAIP